MGPLHHRILRLQALAGVGTAGVWFGGVAERVLTAPVDLSEVRESYEERGLDESDLAAERARFELEWADAMPVPGGPVPGGDAARARGELGVLRTAVARVVAEQGAGVPGDPAAAPQDLGELLLLRRDGAQGRA